MIRVTSDNCIYDFAPDAAPAVSVDDGATVLLSTADCFSGQIRDPQTTVGAIDRRLANPATGPVFVNGALPGDTLAVEVLELAAAPWGLSVAVPGMGGLGHAVQSEKTQIVAVDPEGIRFGRIKIPYRPMLGVIGVAPATGAVSTMRPGSHGGNLDCVLVRPGATVYLPVAVPGALFAAGDMHAAMGDGEVSGTGIEVPGTALLRLRVVRDFPVSEPWIETSDTLAVISAADTLDTAARNAAAAATAYITRRLGIEFADSYMLAGAAVRLRICQVVNPQVTVRAEIPKWLLGPASAPAAELRPS